MVQIVKADKSHTALLVSFQQAMARETESLELDASTLHKGVSKVFESPEMGCYYLAIVDGQIAGCMLTLYEWSDWRNARVLWIHSVYVLPEYRRKKVFSALYHHVHNEVLSDPLMAGLRLYVDKSNHTAMAVYKNLGMNNNHYELFEWLK